MADTDRDPHGSGHEPFPEPEPGDDDLGGPAPPKLAVQLRSVPAIQGWRWVRQGVGLTLSRPLAFVGLFAATLLMWMLVAGMLPPLIGTLLAVGTGPIVWLAFMRATRRALAGQPITPLVFFEVWQVPETRRNALMRLCGLYVLAVLAVILLSGLFGGNEAVWQALTSKDPQVQQAAARNPALWFDIAARLSLTLPVSILFWHAPPLVHSVGLKAPKALFFSWMACWHNRWAFAVYGLGWGAVVIVAATLLAVLAALTGSPQLAAFLAMPLSMLLGAAFYASLYFTVADSFEAKVID